MVACDHYSQSLVKQCNLSLRQLTSKYGPVQVPVSVIIPTYNRCKLLCTAIESVLEQTLQPSQIIVVDDGSEDSTSATVAKRFPDVLLIQQTNHGVSHARNRGIAAASNPWIAFLDSDDRWFENKLAVQMNAIQASPMYRLCHCDEHWIRNGKRVNPMHKHQKRGGDIFEFCLPLCAISPSAVIIHQSLFDEVGNFDESLPACEDYDLWLRICSGNQVLFVDSALLEKTGGHEDQLSRKHWGMDRFRLVALSKLLRSHSLSDDQKTLVEPTFKQKYQILHNGATKRGNDTFAKELESLYSDLLA